MSEQSKPQPEPEQPAEGGAQQPAGPPAPPALPTVSREGGFAQFVRTKTVQIAGAGLIGIFVGAGAVATGVAVAQGGDGAQYNLSRQWTPDSGQGGPSGGFSGGQGQRGVPGPQQYPSTGGAQVVPGGLAVLRDEDD